MEKVTRAQMKYGCLKRQRAVFGDSKAPLPVQWLQLRKVNA